MKKKNLILLYFILSILCFCRFSATAQLHFKVGYTAGYFQPEENNKLLQAYNERNPTLTEKFDDVNWQHGLDVGLRYRIGFVGLEASWRASFTNAQAEGRVAATNAAFKKRFNYRFNSFSFGVENYIGAVGLGVALGYNRMSITERTSNDRFDLLKTDQWTGTLFLGFYTKHDSSISFGLRPFVQLPIGQFDISKLAQNLGEPATGELLEKEYMTFGISLVMFNGY